MERWNIYRAGGWGAVLLAAMTAYNEGHVWRYGLRGVVTGVLIMAAAAAMGFMIGAAIARLRNFAVRRSLVD